MAFTFNHNGEQLDSRHLAAWEQELRVLRAEIGRLHDRYLQEGLRSTDEILAAAEKLQSSEERLCEIINLARSMQDKRDWLAQWSKAVTEAKERGDIPA